MLLMGEWKFLWKELILSCDVGEKWKVKTLILFFLFVWSERYCATRMIRNIFLEVEFIHGFHGVL